MGEIVSKGRFAELLNVSPGRVSQWLSEGKVTGDAIVGAGRFAKIDVDLARAQLGETLDVDQRHSGNGLKTNLAITGEAAPVANTLERQLLEERLLKARRENVRDATEQASANGELCATADARSATVKEVSRMVARVEGALPEFAAAIAAKFKLPQRDVLHELKAKWRQVRTDAAIEARERAEPLPEKVGFDVDTDSEC